MHFKRPDGYGIMKRENEKRSMTQIIGKNHEERPGYSYAVILPDTSRLSTLTWDGSPRFGLFRVRETASFLEREEVFERVVFVCPIWLLALVIFFIVLAVIWIILRIE